MAKKFDRKEITDKLIEKGASQPCHRCGHKSFSVIDGFSTYYLTDEYGKAVLGGLNVPVITAACNNCGAITQHAVGALIEIEKPTKEERKEAKDAD